MATLQDLLDDLNQRLGDANNAAGEGEAAKIRWMQNGIRAMWPKCYQVIVDDFSLTIDDTVYEYTLPATFDDSEVYRIEVQVGSSFQRWARVDEYLIDSRSSKVLTFKQLPGINTAGLRIHAVAPVTVPTLTGDTLDFPARFLEVPVWYALGLAMQNGHEDRLDFARYNTVINRNGVDVAELMSSAQFCFAQFELLLDRLAMPWPAS